jgi:hypothetical protein
MSLDDRIRRDLHEAGDALDADPRSVLERFLPTARRRRGRRRAAQAALGVMAAAGLVAGGVRLVPELDLRARPGGPTPGPTGTVIEPSPGTRTPADLVCLAFNVSRESDLDDARHECGLIPASVRVEGGTAYRLRAPSGHSFWAVFRDEVRVGSVLAMPDVLMAIRGVPVVENPVAQFFTTEDPRDAVDRSCHGEPECDPQVVEGEVLPNGALLQRWEDASGTVPLDVSTLDLGDWLAVLEGTRGVERIARALEWREDEDGFLILSSSDPEVSIHHDWSSLRIGIGTNAGFFWGRVLPDCHLSEKEPDLGGNDYGPGFTYSPGPGSISPSARWCTGGYAIDIDGAEVEEARRIYRGLRVVPTLGD